MPDVDEIADGIHRIATFVPEEGLTFNQFLLAGDEPLLFHTGPRAFSARRSQASRGSWIPPAALGVVVALRSRRVRCAQRLPRARAGRRAGAQ
jgi:hypothetical protein